MQEACDVTFNEFNEAEKVEQQQQMLIILGHINAYVKISAYLIVHDCTILPAVSDGLDDF